MNRLTVVWLLLFDNGDMEPRDVAGVYYERGKDEPGLIWEKWEILDRPRD